MADRDAEFDAQEALGEHGDGGVADFEAWLPLCKRRDERGRRLCKRFRLLGVGRLAEERRETADLDVAERRVIEGCPRSEASAAVHRV